MWFDVKLGRHEKQGFAEIVFLLRIFINNLNHETHRFSNNTRLRELTSFLRYRIKIQNQIEKQHKRLKTSKEKFSIQIQTLTLGKGKLKNKL